jgi:hypothetical protein
VLVLVVVVVLGRFPAQERNTGCSTSSSILGIDFDNQPNTTARTTTKNEDDLRI